MMMGWCLVGLQAAAADDPGHPGPAPLDPVPAGPLTSSRIVFGVMLFYPSGQTGDPPTSRLRTLCRTRFRVFRGLSDLEATGSRRSEPAVPFVKAGISRVRPPDQASLDAGSHGLTAAQRAGVRRSREALVVGIHGAPRGWLPILRSAHMLILDLAQETGGLIWDGHSRECFTADAWRQRRLVPWRATLPPVASLVRIRRDGERAVTLGMDRFGLPNLVVEQPSPGNWPRAEGVLWLAAHALVESPRLKRSGRLSLDPAAVRDPALALRIGAAGRSGPIALPVRIGVRRQGDPRTRLIEILLSGGESPAPRDAVR